MRISPNFFLTRHLREARLASPAQKIRMKVLLVGHTYLVPINWAKLNALVSIGIDLQVLQPANWRNLDGLFLGKVPAQQSEDGRPLFLMENVVRPGHTASHLFTPLQALRTVARVRPDLIHIENEGYSYLATEMAALAKYVSAKTTLFVWENLDRRIHWSQTVCRKITLPMTNGLVCGSSGAEGQYRRWGFRGPTAVIPQLGVDPTLFHATEKLEASRPFTVGYIGRLVHQKGCDILLTASQLLGSRGLNLRCKICGSGPERAELEALSDRLRLGSIASFHDTVSPEEVPGVLNTLDVLVLPSRTVPFWAEQLGHILLEAMSAGVVVVGSRSGAIPEVIGQDSLLFQEDDPQELAAILAKLADNSEFYRESREYGMKRVKQKYTHEVIARQLAAFWSSVLNGRE
jgi:glycosyltransferase involved in cell wall biosynthesis